MQLTFGPFELHPIVSHLIENSHPERKSSTVSIQDFIPATNFLFGLDSFPLNKRNVCELSLLMLKGVTIM